MMLSLWSSKKAWLIGFLNGFISVTLEKDEPSMLSILTLEMVITSSWSRSWKLCSDLAPLQKSPWLHSWEGKWSMGRPAIGRAEGWPWKVTELFETDADGDVVISSQ